jgi:hypothetical protein
VAGPDDPDDRDDPPRTPRDDEPRAGDIARAKSTADLDEKLDPQTVAQLAAWFGLPSFEQLEEQQRKAAEPPPDEFAAHNEMLARIEPLIEPGMIALLERHTGRGDRMLGDRLPPPMESMVRELAKFDPRLVDRVGSIAEPVEVRRPDWIDEAMAENTPQAILRDLHRPEDIFRIGYSLPDPEPGLKELTGDLRALATTSYKVTPNEPSGATAMRDSLTELRYWKAQDWGVVEFPKMSTAEGPEDVEADQTEPSDEGAWSDP